MEYSHRYHSYPTQQVAERLKYHIDVHRQAYNYTRYEYEHVDADGRRKGRTTTRSNV